jgi:hypothetical protein
MIVSSPKTECHGKPTRQVPLFKELRPYLEAAWDVAPDGAVYVLPERYRNSANKATGWRNCNLRTQFERIVERAGLEKWPRLFHAMRSSCESDLVKRHPLHMAARWLGNTPRIAEKHYLITSDADFNEAAGIDRGDKEQSGAESGAPNAPPGQNAVQNAVQHAARNGSHKAKPRRNLCEFLRGYTSRFRLAKRRGGDSNPRYLAVRRFSRPVHSATLPPLRGSRGLCGADCR